MVTENRQHRKPKKPKKVNNLRHAEYYDMQETFDGLYAQAKGGGVFERLKDLIFSRDNILLAYRNIKRNDGSVTPGTDGLTIRDIEKFTPDGLIQKVRNITKNYSPRAVRRKEIPKPYDPTKTRPLGIPCIWDRLIQQCIPSLLSGEPSRNNALLLAALYNIRNNMPDAETEGPDMAEPEAAPESAADNVSEQKDKAGAEWLIQTAGEELSDADMYYAKWISTDTPEYKEIALDEIRHFEILVKIIRDNDASTDIQGLMMRHNSLLAKLA